MTIFNAISLLGGLALFLYGMTVMANNLERMSGGRLEATMSKITDNIFKSIALGAIVTICIQSSSATTVILVGLVNARILKLRQAIGVIMGANIGTTLTAHMLRLTSLDETASTNILLNLIKPTTLAPAAAIVGILVYFLAKRSAQRDIGQMLLGFSVLFTGMFAMEAAVEPLRGMPEVANLFVAFQNPLLGVLVGTVFTAAVQASSATIGILQALASTGVVTYAAAYPIVMGLNIGTCITPVLASIGASKGAKRTAFVHVAFNVIGTIIFLTAILIIQQTGLLDFWYDPIDKGGIANFHSLFNLLTTLLFIPFTSLLEKMAYVAFKPDADENHFEVDTALLDERFLVSPSFAIANARDAVLKMADYSLENYNRSVELLVNYDKKSHDYAKEVEEVIDRLQSGVDVYLLKLTHNELTEADTVALSEVLQVVNEYERIGDHADALCNIAANIRENQISFSPMAWEELDTVTSAVREILEIAIKGYRGKDSRMAISVEPLEEVIDILVEALKVHHSNRMREGLCSADSAFPFVEILYNLERIADHCSNIGIHTITYSKPGETLDRHEYLRQMRRTPPPEYKERFDYYDKKYYGKVRGLGIGS